MRVWRLTTGSTFIRSGISLASLTRSKKQSDKAVILSEAKRSRRISLRYRRVTQRDLIRSLPVRSASGLRVHVAASPAAPFSTSLGMTHSLEVGQIIA